MAKKSSGLGILMIIVITITVLIIIIVSTSCSPWSYIQSINEVLPNTGQYWQETNLVCMYQGRPTRYDSLSFNSWQSLVHAVANLF